MRRPSPALAVATVALFVALGGTAGAVVTAAVPLAKRALVADNAKKLGGMTSAQIAAQGAKAAVTLSPAGAREASSAAGVVSLKTSSASLPANGGSEFTISCDAGQRVAGGGFSSDGAVFNLDSYPASDSSWRLFLANGSETSGASVTLYATCIR
jgi:hypothetical protein